MKWCRFRLISLLLLVGCAQTQEQSSHGISSFAKSDIGEVIETHQRAVMADLKALMIKLYKRNPSTRYDRDKRTIEESVDYTFSLPFDTEYRGFKHLDKPTDIVRLALSEEYRGDRVLAFTVGLRKMLMASYDNHIEFFYLTSIDEQKLYNSARNIEIAAWLMANKTDNNGRLMILSDSLEAEIRNLSYQRLIGKMIATQDNIATIISQKEGRLIKTVVVKAASMVFLPI